MSLFKDDAMEPLYAKLLRIVLLNPSATSYPEKIISRRLRRVMLVIGSGSACMLLNVPLVVSASHLFLHCLHDLSLELLGFDGIDDFDILKNTKNQIFKSTIN